MTTLTDEMEHKAWCRAIEATKSAVWPERAAIRAAIEAILPELTRAARAEGCREAAACGGDTADAMVSEILARATAIEKGEE